MKSIRFFALGIVFCLGASTFFTRTFEPEDTLGVVGGATLLGGAAGGSRTAAGVGGGLLGVWALSKAIKRSRNNRRESSTEKKLRKEKEKRKELEERLKKLEENK